MCLSDRTSFRSFRKISQTRTAPLLNAPACPFRRSVDAEMVKSPSLVLSPLAEPCRTPSGGIPSRRLYSMKKSALWNKTGADFFSRDGAVTHSLTPTHRRANIMGFFSKDITTLDELFVHTLRDIYYAEKQIEEALPEMIGKATSPELKSAFETHLAETRGHIERVEKVFEMHDVKTKGVDCPAIDGILEEAKEVSGDVEDKQVLDAALIASAQAVEHYEITRYGTLIAWAREIGRDDCAAVLAENLEEEETTDRRLSELAERRINRQAA